MRSLGGCLKEENALPKGPMANDPGWVQLHPKASNQTRA